MATWGTLTWSTGNFGDQTNSTFPPNGIGASFNLGTVVITATVDFGWSNNAWGLVDWNTNELNADGIVTGFGMTNSLGDETTINEVNLGWSRLTWGEFAWGIAGTVLVSGNSMAASLGDESTVVDVTPEVTGIAMTSSLGDESIEISFEIEVTGNALTSNLGIADAGPDAMLQGIGATGSVGNVEAYNLEGWGRYFWGQFEWGATGEWEFVTPIGISMSANVGTIAVTGTADVDVTGEAMTAEEGIVDPSPDAEVTGIGFDADLAVGTVIAGEANVTVVGEGFAAGLGVGNLDAVTLSDVTGIAMSASVGNVTITAEATTNTTGIDLTMALGTNRTLIWNQVNTGTAPTWTEVDTAA
jgi:hypothetical protein